MSRPKLTPQIAFNLAERLFRASGERDERLESVIIQDLMFAYFYVRDILKTPWPEAESLIAQDQVLGYWYAREVLKRRERERVGAD